ncbi:MAG: thiosulfate/3-mercaptopyruvate sulfurtransferase [Cellvibrionaceae bacterium]|jgi:thiosulfate/3-mercaptopyruvate sulfurtransferase
MHASTLFSTLIEVNELLEQLNQPHLAKNLIVIDCRFKMVDPAAGEAAYQEKHIPGAVYAHLDRDLSGKPVTDKGRHPMLSAEAMNALFSRSGIEHHNQVVIYDDMRGAIASRLWWMLQYMGHEATAVLNGAWQAWEAAEAPTATGEESNPPSQFKGTPNSLPLVTLNEVLIQPSLIDSRSAPRYRGEEEPLDPVAGHIPGAENYFFGQNFGEDGRFLSKELLEENFSKLLGTISAADTTFYCGSGVTACTNLLALAHSGLGHAKLYGGSWSEWCRERPGEIG